MDTVEKANSGHPGAPLGCAPIAYLLFHKLMKHNPAHSKWADRDRFVLSNGHASALLYGSLFLSGYNVTLDDLKSFRQWGSKTPGHPEYGVTDGVEATTGPLGQGFGMAVGMAIAERHLAATYNRPGFNVVDHHTFVLCGDGDLMEGISHEAASLAGTLGLGKLIVLYDDNLISLDGPTEWSFTEDVYKRFEAYHWHVQRVMDGNDLDGIEAAIAAAKAEERQAIADRGAHGDRLRQPEGRHEQGARRGDGRGGYGGDEEVLRVPGGPELLRAGRRADELARGGEARRGARGGVEQALCRIQGGVSGAGGGV